MAEPDIKRRRLKPRKAVVPTGGGALWGEMADANKLAGRRLPGSYVPANPQADVLRGAAEKGRRQGPDIAGMLAAFNGAANTAPTASGSGGGGGGGSTGGRTKPPAGDQWDGFAGRYVPGERDLLFSNPRIIVDDWLAQGPYRKNPQMAGDLGRYADIVFGNENMGGLYELLTGGNLDPDVTGDDDQINYLVNLLNEQSKVGGKSPTIQNMLEMLYRGFGDEESSMGGLLTDGNGNPVPTQAAIGALMQFIPLLGEFTGNIRYSNAMRRQANRLAQDYMGMQAKGKNKGTFLDYLKNNFLT